MILCETFKVTYNLVEIEAGIRKKKKKLEVNAEKTKKVIVFHKGGRREGDEGWNGKDTYKGNSKKG